MSLDDAILRLQAAQGDPDRMVLATAEIVLEGRNDPQLGPVFEAAAVPRWFDAAILAALLDTDETTSAEWVTRLKALPMVESFAARNGWNVHEATRLAMRRHLAQSQPARLRELSARAAACFPAKDPVARVERTYHRLLAAPELGAVELLALWQEWYRAGRHEVLQALGVALDDLLRASVLAGGAHARALVSLGWIRSGRLPLRQAAAMAREAITLFDAAADPQGQIDARDQLGDVLQLSGDLAGALGAYRECHDITSRLVRDAPDNTDWQRDLAVSHNKVGGVHQAQGQLVAALAEYQAYQRIMQTLVAREPDNTGWQRDLAVSHYCVGGVYEAQGRLAAALAEYQAGQDILQTLVARDPDNTDWQRDLAVSHNKVGGVYEAQGRLAEALAEYQAYQGIMQTLVARDPDNTGWQRDLAVSHNNVGDVCQGQGQLAAALAEYQAGQGIMQALVARDPDNTGWQRDLSVSHNRVGSVYQAQGQLVAALAEYEADLAIAERLAAGDPSNAQWQDDLECTRQNVDALRRQVPGV